MRICFLGDAGSIHLQRWIQYFVNAGSQVEVISFRPCPLHDVKVHLLADGRSGRIAYFQALLKIRRLLREIRPDVLHAHYATSFGLLAMVSGFKPLVVSAWGSDILVAPQESAVLRRVVSQVLRHADALTSDSLYMSQRMLELLQGKQSILKTVTMGVSQDWFDNIPEAGKKTMQILSLRGHQEVYNIDIVIQAMSEVVRSLPKAKLIIAGEGPETSKLKQLAKSLNLDQSVIFVGQLPHAKVQSYLNESAISVSVPSSDATAVSLLETMACGSFPVVSDLPANREWIDPGINGLLVPAKDILTLAQALIEAIDNSELRQKAQEINRRRVKEKAIWEDNMQEMAELYEKILTDYGKPAGGKQSP